MTLRALPTHPLTPLPPFLLPSLIYAVLWLWEDQYYVWPLENATNSDSFDNGLHRWGLSYWLPASDAVRPAWYSFTMLTRFLRAPGQGGDALATALVSGNAPSTGVVVAAVAGQPGAAAPGYRAFLLVNEADSPASVALAVVGGSAEPLRRFLYNPAAPPPGGGATLVQPSGAPWPSSAQGWLNDTLPPRAVVLWVSSSGL